jgi:hypothetical protein
MSLLSALGSFSSLVPAMIMDWKFSRGDPTAPATRGYSFPAREVNFILLLGMSTNSDQGCRVPGIPCILHEVVPLPSTIHRVESGNNMVSVKGGGSV